MIAAVGRRIDADSNITVILESSDEIDGHWDSRINGSAYGSKLLRRTRVGPVGDKIGSPVHPLTKVSPGGEPHPRPTRARAAQGGVPLEPEQG
jgi:hypothetical protein